MDLERLLAVVFLSDDYRMRCAFSVIRSLSDIFSKYEDKISLVIREKRKLILDNISYLEKSKRIKWVTLWDEAYPQKLKEIADPPIVLFYIGDISVLKRGCVAVVGSRRATLYGRDVASRLGMRLSECGVVVVSGGAIGVDTAAHRGAVDAGGVTVVVMGCGLKGFYPRSNTSLFERIIDKGGLILSEFLPLCPASKYSFPRRNRIISGLSDVVVVVEAAERSGALITARLALEQGRDVYAVPGQINSIFSSGTNRLISEGAYVLRDIEEFLFSIGVVESNLSSAKEGFDDSLDDISRAIISYLRDVGSISMDKLIEEVGGNSFDILRKVSILELEGKIIRDGNMICLR